MKRILELGTVAVLLALGAAHTKAATTNYWVQNVNLALTAYVQGNNQILQGALPTKQFLSFLSGVANPAVVGSQTVVLVTNNIPTNLTVQTAQFWLLPDPAVPPENMPRSYTVTSNYVLTPDAGLTSYINNINFTNDVVVTRTGGPNPAYAFYNAVTVSSNKTAYLFPELPAGYITAVWTNPGPGAVFVLSGSVLTNSVGTRTNYTYGNNPDFTRQAGAKLLLITPIVNGTNLASRYVVRYMAGGKSVDTDVNAFLHEYQGSPYVAVYQYLTMGAQTRLSAFSEIDFNNGAGTGFYFNGFDTQVWGPLVLKGSVISRSVLKQRKLEVSNYSGFISGQVQNRTFKNATTVVKGTITINGGKIE